MKALLQVENLSVTFYRRRGEVQAVRGVSFKIYPGETVALVGESGCGKSVTGRAIMKLLPGSSVCKIGGSIIFGGENLKELTEIQMERLRGNELSMIFQDPAASLNPTMKIGRQIAEVFMRHKGQSWTEARFNSIKLLEDVEIPRAEKTFGLFPHQLSGGMRQRVMIAIALAGGPKLLIADEPTASLDTTVQAQIIELIKNASKKRDMSVLFITHDLGIIAGLADRVFVMYAGTIVETGSIYDIFYSPKHPYTVGLLKSAFNPLKPDEIPQAIPGQPPDPSNLPGGCSFYPRCNNVLKICPLKKPPYFKKNKFHFIACWQYHPFAAGITESPI